MSRRLYLLLVMVLAVGLVVTGCGDDDEDSGSSGGGDKPAQESTKKDSGGGGGNAAPGLGSAEAKQAAEQCKTSIGAQAQLSSDVKKDLEEICEEAADGDEDAVRKASKDVCLKIVEETAPKGPAADQAKQACNQATQAP